MANDPDHAGDLLRELLQHKTAQLAKTEELRLMLLRFLPVFDSLLRLVSHAENAASPHLAAWTQQVQIINEQMLEIFEEYGVSFMSTIGQPFDPHTQEAVGTEVAEGLPDRTVLKEIRRGGWWNGTLLRTAQVIIVKNND